MPAAGASLTPGGFGQLSPAASPGGRSGVDRADVMDLGDDEEEIGEGEDEAVHFVLLAEFDIDLGSTISQQYPYPTGTDEQ